MSSLSIVCWLWRTPGYRSTFGPAAVNALACAVARNYAPRHRFMCVTDQPEGIDPEIEIVPAWNDFADVPSPHGAANPSCYRRLRAFHPDAAQWFGERFVSLDLDWVITGDLQPLWNRPESFVALRDPFWPAQFNGSMFLLTAGARPQVWNDFRRESSPVIARQAGFKGSDQAWISYRLPGAPTWDTRDGVYSYRKDIEPTGGKLPHGARMVNFHGRTKPWDDSAHRLDWVHAHWGSDWEAA